MATLAELTTPQTRADFEAEIYAAITSAGGAHSTWKPGSVVRAIITGVSVVLAGLSHLQVATTKGGFLELATGDWLTLVAEHVYQIERELGSFASGSVVLDNAAGGVFSLDPGDLIVRTADGRTYRNTEAFTLGALEEDVAVAVEATDLGAAGNASAGEINALETTLLGVTVTNPLALRGVDPETDAQLRVRCHAKIGTLSPNGPRDAYHYIALAAERTDGASVGITRVRTIADGAGGVRVIVANASGPVTAPDVAIVDATIQAGAVPHGVTAVTESAIASVIAPTYELWVRDSHELTNDDLEDAIEEALGAYLGNAPIGGFKLPGESIGRVYHNALAAVIANAVGEGFVDVDLTVPAANVDLAENEAAALGIVTVTTIHRVEA